MATSSEDKTHPLHLIGKGFRQQFPRRARAEAHERTCPDASAKKEAVASTRQDMRSTTANSRLKCGQPEGRSVPSLRSTHDSSMRSVVARTSSQDDICSPLLSRRPSAPSAVDKRSQEEDARLVSDRAFGRLPIATLRSRMTQLPQDAATTPSPRPRQGGQKRLTRCFT